MNLKALLYRPALDNLVMLVLWVALGYLLYLAGELEARLAWVSE